MLLRLDLKHAARSEQNLVFILDLRKCSDIHARFACDCEQKVAPKFFGSFLLGRCTQEGGIGENGTTTAVESQGCYLV